jgi:hypothetical protein
MKRVARVPSLSQAAIKSTPKGFSATLGAAPRQNPRQNASQKWGILGNLGRGTKDVVGAFESNSGSIMSYKPMEVDLSLSLEGLEKILRERILGRTARDTLNKEFVSRAFAKVDVNGRGLLNAKNMKTAFANWGVRPSDSLLDKAFAKWDVDRSGAIDLNEFMALVLGSDFDLKEKSVYNRFTEEDCPTSSPQAMLNFQQGMQGRQPLHRAPKAEHMKTMQSRGCRLTQQMDLPEVVELIREKIFLQSNSNCAGRTAAIYKMLGCPARGMSPKALKNRLTMWGIHVTDEQLLQMFAQIGRLDSRGWVAFSDFMKYFGADAGSECQEHPLGTVDAWQGRGAYRGHERSSNPTKLDNAGKKLVAGRFQSPREAADEMYTGLFGAYRAKDSPHKGRVKAVGTAAQESAHWQQHRDEARGISAHIAANQKVAWDMANSSKKATKDHTIHSPADRERRARFEEEQKRLQSELSQSWCTFMGNRIRPFSCAPFEHGPNYPAPSPAPTPTAAAISASMDSLDRQFHHRLLHNLLHAAQQKASSGSLGKPTGSDVMALLTQKGLLPTKRVSEKIFRAVIREHFSRPRAIPAHILNTAVAHYRTHGLSCATEKGKSPINTKLMHDDLMFMHEVHEQQQQQQQEEERRRRKQQQRVQQPSPVHAISLSSSYTRGNASASLATKHGDPYKKIRRGLMHSKLDTALLRKADGGTRRVQQGGRSRDCW